MYFTTTVLPALMGAMLAFTAEAAQRCNPAALNTTSFNYVNSIENQTVHEIAKKFNRGVCDIGRANLSQSICSNASQHSLLTVTI
jgi:hypothetical protein